MSIIVGIWCGVRRRLKIVRRRTISYATQTPRNRRLSLCPKDDVDETSQYEEAQHMKKNVHSIRIMTDTDDFLQRQIVPNFFFRKFSERRFRPPRLSANLAFLEFRGCGNRDDTDLNRLLCHLTFETLLQREQRRMDSVLQTNVIVVPAFDLMSRKGA